TVPHQPQPSKGNRVHSAPPQKTRNQTRESGSQFNLTTNERTAFRIVVVVAVACEVVGMQRWGSLAETRSVVVMMECILSSGCSVFRSALHHFVRLIPKV